MWWDDAKYLSLPSSLLHNTPTTSNTSFSKTRSLVVHPYTNYQHVFTPLAVFNSSCCPSSRDQRLATSQPAPIVYEVLLATTLTINYIHQCLRINHCTPNFYITMTHNQCSPTHVKVTLTSTPHYFIHLPNQNPQESLHITTTQRQYATNQINYRIHIVKHTTFLLLLHNAKHIEAPLFSSSLPLPCKWLNAYIVVICSLKSH